MKDLSDFVDLKPSKHPEFHHPAFARVRHFQPLQRLMNSYDFRTSVRRYLGSLIERNHPQVCTAFGIIPGAREVDKNAPHHSRASCKEVRPVLPLHIPPVDQPKVGFVDERGGLQHVAGPLARHKLVRHPVQFLINRRSEPLQRFFVAIAPCL